jgi:hypothetical protein
MKKLSVLTLLLLSSTPLMAQTFHLSPEIKMGPYITSGLSGGGLQIGVRDQLGLDALYVSYSHTSATILTDKDRLKTYRVGGQYMMPHLPFLGVQFEIGGVENWGSRAIPGRPDKTATGVSIAASWVAKLNDHWALRAGMDVNYLDRANTYLGYHTSATFSTGVVISF